MANPVLIDDGGSTRIKQLTPNANMDTLLDPGHAAFANGQFVFPGPPPVARCILTLVHIEHVDPPVPGGPLATQPPDETLNANDIVQIDSENDQSITIKLNTSKRLEIELLPTAAGAAEPIVEAKQHGDQRRYIVSNAGPIMKVTIKPAVGAARTVFTATIDTMYTMVQLRSA